MTPPQESAEVQALVALEGRRSEHIAARLRLVLGGLGVLAILGNLESNTPEALAYSFGITLLTLAWAVTTFVLTRNDGAPGWTKWVSVVVDTSFVTVFAASGLFNHSGAYETLLAPLTVGLYPTLILLTALTGSRAATITAGLLAAVQRALLLYLIVDAELVSTTDVALYGSADVSLPDQYTIVGFLAVIGLIFGYLAHLLRRDWSRSAVEFLAKQEAERRQAQIRKYLSPNVADYVLSDPEAMGLGGKRHTASVMFVDIRDFTPFAERERPEVVVEFLNRAFAKLVDIVFRHGGTLDKFLGDGMMVVFGVPKAMDDAPLAAVRAAQEMMAAVAELNREAPAGSHAFRIGVGIAHGVVVAGNVGTHNRMEFTVIGDTVNYAARLQALCKDLAQDIVVSDEVHGPLVGRFPMRRMPPIKVKGRSGEPMIWAIVGPESPSHEATDS